MIDALRRREGKRSHLRQIEIKRECKRIAWMLVSKYTDFEWVDDKDLDQPIQEVRQFSYWHGHLMTRFGLGYTTSRYMLERAISDQKWECFLKDTGVHQGDTYSPKQCANLINNILSAVKYSNNSVFT